ncbi:hypothetical protein IJS77_03305 [bacterium]|nr:hypothetical protein [bacterium]
MINQKPQLKVEYIPPSIDFDEKEEHLRLVRFVTLFSQVGFKEFCLNPDSKIKFNYCNK